MRRLAVAILISFLLTAGPGPAALGQSLTPVDSGGRVEVAEAGYALTFPGDWLVANLTADDVQDLIDGIRENEPDLASLIEAGLASGSSVTLMAFGPAGDDGWSPGCSVITSSMTGWSLEEITQAELANFELLPEED